MAGEENVLWPGETKWFAQSSGTTTDQFKWLPVTRDALQRGHYRGGKDLLAQYCAQVPEAQLYQGKHLILGGSSALVHDGHHAVKGDLSAIIVNHLPPWCEARRTPDKSIALMDDWTSKVDAIAEATMTEDVRILAGVPSWMALVCQRVLEKSGKSNLWEVWPNLWLYMHGGVGFAPYRRTFQSLLPPREGKPKHPLPGNVQRVRRLLRLSRRPSTGRHGLVDGPRDLLRVCPHVGIGQG